MKIKGDVMIGHGRRAIPTVPCELCGTPTRMLGTKRCDPCREVERAVQGNPELARRVLAALDEDSRRAPSAAE